MPKYDTGRITGVPPFGRSAEKTRKAGLEGILVDTAAPPQSIHSDSFRAFQDFITTISHSAATLPDGAA